MVKTTKTMIANGWVYETYGFKSGIPSRYMNVNVGDELTIMANNSNMKSWLVPTFRVATAFDSQFFILCVSRSVFIY